MAFHRTIGILALVYVCGIILLHAVPFGDAGIGEVKVGPVRETHLFHLAMFLPWGLIGSFYVSRASVGGLRRAFIWIFFGLFLAVAAEGIQHWIPYRSFTLLDLIFNLAGVLLGSPAMFIHSLFRYVKLKKTDPRPFPLQDSPGEGAKPKEGDLNSSASSRGNISL